MTTSTTTLLPVYCRRCGRPLTNAVSRVLQLGERCRLGLTEHQLTSAEPQ